MKNLSAINFVFLYIPLSFYSLYPFFICYFAFRSYCITSSLSSIKPSLFYPIYTPFRFTFHACKATSIFIAHPSLCITLVFDIYDGVAAIFFFSLSTLLFP